jgi:hypothetical protein
MNMHSRRVDTEALLHYAVRNPSHNKSMVMGVLFPAWLENRMYLHAMHLLLIFF